ncbi:MAG TPA: methionyl-tRNA formyltransferase [Candidatus Krumholzibacteria bacterium]|nr:methionyl-tRNA formyltransferase [Candidatus Krumholzibacteria bacterium]HRX50298.1 methionyl-tRNA formyltransferase [Candidatus Krumholzibacteria bacterium]
MRIVFMGSPDFAVPTLDALVEARCDIPLVVTQPDRARGRGRKVETTAVKAAAQRHGLPVMDWGRGDAAAVTARVRELQPDAVVVVAFGHILRESLLNLPRFGCINLHASLLPRWRGVSPVHYAILHGDLWTGVSVMRMDAGVDTGPVLAERALAIDPEATSGELLETLAGQGADLMVYTLRGLEAGTVHARMQNDEGAVYAPKLNRSLSPIRWERPVLTVHNQIRGLNPWPGAVTFLDERQLKVTEARPEALHVFDAEPGTVLAADVDGLVVACGEGALRVTGLQNPGKRPMTAAEYLRGRPVPVGSVLRS